MPRPISHQPIDLPYIPTWIAQLQPQMFDKEEQQPQFPANTPVRDMTVEQQAAYHAHHSRKHENRVKAFGEWTPEKIAELVTERDTLKSKTQTTEEQQLEAAKAAGRSEVLGQLNQERVDNALERAFEGRIPHAAALLKLDRQQFIKDGKADVEAVKKWAVDNSDESVAPKRTPRLGQGKQQEIQGGLGERGRAEAEKRFAKQRAATSTTS